MRLLALAQVFASRPLEGADRVLGRLELRRGTAQRAEAAGVYKPHAGWAEVLHVALGDSARGCEQAYAEIWQAVECELHGDVGEGHDCDPELAAAIWCSVRHTKARVVVETGVARGVSSRFVLEAFGDDRGAHLWSVELPPLEASWASQVGVAVPDRLHDQWTYLRGSTRRVLPALLDDIGPIDVFVHDSRGTLDTASFEFASAWVALRDGGILVASSIERSLAFDAFVREVQPAFTVVAPLRRKSGYFGLAQKPAAVASNGSDAPDQRRSGAAAHDQRRRKDRRV